MPALGLSLASRFVVAGALYLVAIASAYAAGSTPTKRALAIDGAAPFHAFVVEAAAPGEFTLRTDGGSQGVVRLFGVDIPVLSPSCLSPDGNRNQCHSAAPDTIARITKRADGQVTCVAVDPNAIPPTVHCLLGDDDLGLVLIQGGHAYAAQKALLEQSRANAAWGPLMQQYMAAEENARVNRRGIWSATTPALPSYNQRRPTAAR